MPRVCTKYTTDPVREGLHPMYEVHRRQALNECWPAPVIMVEGIHVEDIFELVSLVLSLIISWTFRILAHEEDQYTDFFVYSTQTD